MRPITLFRIVAPYDARLHLKIIIKSIIFNCSPCFTWVIMLHETTHYSYYSPNIKTTTTSTTLKNLNQIEKNYHEAFSLFSSSLLLLHLLWLFIISLCEFSRCRFMQHQSHPQWPPLRFNFPSVRFCLDSPQLHPQGNLPFSLIPSRRFW